MGSPGGTAYRGGRPSLGVAAATISYFLSTEDQAIRGDFEDIIYFVNFVCGYWFFAEYVVRVSSLTSGRLNFVFFDFYSWVERICLVVSRCLEVCPGRISTCRIRI